MLTCAWTYSICTCNYGTTVHVGTGVCMYMCVTVCVPDVCWKVIECVCPSYTECVCMSAETVLPLLLCTGTMATVNFTFFFKTGLPNTQCGRDKEPLLNHTHLSSPLQSTSHTCICTCCLQ